MIGSLWFNSFSAGGGGAAAAYELISTTVLGSDTASVSFSGLGTSAAAYKHLQVRIVARSTRSASTNDSLMGRINADTGSNYSRHSLQGNGSTVSSSGNSSQTSFYLGDFTASSATASTFGAFIYDLLDFSQTSKNKTYRNLSGSKSNDSDIRLSSGAWLSTSAVTEVSFFANGGNLLTGSRFSLYGLKG